jgi:hypothetical protein
MRGIDTIFKILVLLSVDIKRRAYLCGYGTNSSIKAGISRQTSWFSPCLNCSELFCPGIFRNFLLHYRFAGPFSAFPEIAGVPC